MGDSHETHCTAFEGFRRIASGEFAQVVLKTKQLIDKGQQAPILIFDGVSSEQIEVDFRGTTEDVLKRLKAMTSRGASTTTPSSPGTEAPRGPGRPKLGVVAREVTLLPRHWDWLNSQPGGASVALRKLVEEARRVNKSKDHVRRSQEAAYRFMSALAGNLPHFEEATRALFAGKREHFDQQVESWPTDVREHVKKLAAGAFQGTDGDPSPRTGSPGRIE